jgi:hypothetical protein
LVHPEISPWQNVEGLEGACVGSSSASSRNLIVLRGFAIMPLMTKPYALRKALMPLALAHVSGQLWQLRLPCGLCRALARPQGRPPSLVSTSTAAVKKQKSWNRAYYLKKKLHVLKVELATTAAVIAPLP